MLILWSIWNAEARKRDVAVSKLEHSCEILEAKRNPLPAPKKKKKKHNTTQLIDVTESENRKRKTDAKHSHY